MNVGTISVVGWLPAREQVGEGAVGDRGHGLRSQHPDSRPLANGLRCQPGLADTCRAGDHTPAGVKSGADERKLLCPADEVGANPSGGPHTASLDFRAKRRSSLRGRRQFSADSESAARTGCSSDREATFGR